jgi:hypothetical protein
MKTFFILHVVIPTFNEEPNQNRKCVGEVKATCLEEAYFKSQNLDRHWNFKKPCRSTSIGDVIQVDDKDFMVASSGFQLLNS